jgi:predicted Zn-ribbon and HTH transcriptional regulator
MARIKTDAYQCERCGHIWLPRKTEKEPIVCPKCKSPYWNRPRTQEVSPTSENKQRKKRVQ